MTKGILVVAALAAVTAAPVTWIERTASADQKPRISLADARAIALRAVPGTITKEELENEHGKLIYSFVIKPADRRQHDKEVNVDANSGAVVSIEDEDGD